MQFSYECKVRYRDPKAKDLVMYLHAWRYKVSLHVSSCNPRSDWSTFSGSRLAVRDEAAVLGRAWVASAS